MPIKYLQKSNCQTTEHFQIPACHAIAAIKDAVKEAVMEGTIPYDHDAAWAYALQIGPGIIAECGVKS